MKKYLLLILIGCLSCSLFACGVNTVQLDTTVEVDEGISIDISSEWVEHQESVGKTYTTDTGTINVFYTVDPLDEISDSLEKSIESMNSLENSYSNAQLIAERQTTIGGLSVFIHEISYDQVDTGEMRGVGAYIDGTNTSGESVRLCISYSARNKNYNINEFDSVLGSLKWET